MSGYKIVSFMLLGGGADLILRCLKALLDPQAFAEPSSLPGSQFWQPSTRLGSPPWCWSMPHSMLWDSLFISLAPVSRLLNHLLNTGTSFQMWFVTLLLLWVSRFVLQTFSEKQSWGCLMVSRISCGWQDRLHTWELDIDVAYSRHSLNVELMSKWGIWNHK